MAFLRDALNNHFGDPSKLTVGICNGFQALIKLGVFDDDVIKDYL
ncbi:phosphoribosylformylglycinamidine synthase subunit PurQ [Patescibacteria group bacterium]|nr:phosphoribosylformylglycinamidine synthase subunit PurQ [Patescibacteria group bacterium]